MVKLNIFDSDMSQSVTINVKNILVYQTAIGIMWNYCYKISANFSKMKLFAKWNQKPNLETDQLLLLKELLLSN